LENLNLPQSPQNKNYFQFSMIGFSTLKRISKRKAKKSLELNIKLNREKEKIMAGALIQIPKLSEAVKIKQKKFSGGFIWGVCFELKEPAAEDGHIIQHIIQTERGTQRENGVIVKNVDRTIQYWEAWEVKKGDTMPQQKQTVRAFANVLGVTVPPGDTTLEWDLPVNDIFFRKYAIGARGNYTINGLAGFYHKALPPDFIIAHPQTGAGALKSTITKPEFWNINGLNRQVRFDYVCETPQEAKDDSKQHLNGETTIMNMSYFDSWLKTEKAAVK